MPQSQLHLTKTALRVFIWCTAVALALCLMPTVLLAATATDATPQQAWWQAALMPILSVLGLAIAAFLVGGLRKLVQLIEAKWSIDIPDSFENLMYSRAEWIVGYIEEKAENRLLYGDKQKTPGAEKVTEAVDTLFAFAEANGFGEEWTKEKIKQLVEGVLHLNRDQAVGSTGERAAALTAAKK